MAGETRPRLELPFTFEQRTIGSETTTAGALVMTPRQPVVFDDGRVKAVCASPGLSQVEEEMLRRIEGRDSNTPTLILRAADDDGTRLWEFDPSFSDDQLAAAAHAFVRSLLPFYRRVASSGIVLFVHAEWRSRDLAILREAVAAIPTKAAHSVEDEKRSELDDWIFRNMLMFSSLSLNHVLKKLLPHHLSLLSRRQKRASGLVRSVGDGRPR